MPGMDGTGPFGNGPIGRGMGLFGNGQGGQRRGHGVFGFKTGWAFEQTVAPVADKKETLEQRKNWLENHLTEINKRIKEMEGEKQDNELNTESS